MNSTFLLLDIFLLLLPFLLMLDQKRVSMIDLKRAIIPSIVVLFFFSETVVFFAANQIWQFNAAYLLRVNFRGVPLEAYLFIFASSFSGLGIYNYLNARFPNNELEKYSLAVSNLMLGVCIAFLFFAYSKWYTAITFGTLFILLILIEYVNKRRFMYKFYRAFVASLIVFYINYGLICNLPIIKYDTLNQVNQKLAMIPFENHFYWMGMLLLSVFLFEYLKNKLFK